MRRRNTDTRRLMRALREFELGEYWYDHAGKLSELQAKLWDVHEMIESCIEQRLAGECGEEVAKELGE